MKEIKKAKMVKILRIETQQMRPKRERFNLPRETDTKELGTITH